MSAIEGWPKDVIRAAKEEYAAEKFREAVEAYKERLRLKRSRWARLFPWRIVILRKNDV